LSPFDSRGWASASFAATRPPRTYAIILSMPRRHFR
jgi:hypothetical protein